MEGAYLELKTETEQQMVNNQCEFSCLYGYRRISRSSKNYRTALLFKAVKRRKVALIRQLLKYGVRINAKKACCRRHRKTGKFYTFLMLNGIYGNSNVTGLLVRAGCRLDTATLGGCTALHFAIEYHNRGVAAELIRYGADVHLSTERGGTPLHVATVCSTHIDSTADLLCRNSKRFLSLMSDASQCLSTVTSIRVSSTINKRHSKGQKRRVCLYIVTMLLEAGADVNRKDDYGCSPIHYAAFTSSLELLNILVEAGADLDSRNTVGASALHNAVMFDDEAMVLLLLSRGASISLKTREGNTALHWASALYSGEDSSEAVIRCLIDFGSDVNEANIYGRTSFELLVVKWSCTDYIAELEARIDANIFGEHNLAIIDRNPYLKSLYEELRIDLLAMKNVDVGNSQISYFAVLTRPTEEVARWIGDEKFLMELEDTDCQTCFPMYAQRLREKIDAAKRMKRKTVKWIDVSSYGIYE